MTDQATMRRMMVDTQVRPSDVTKYSIIDAMLSVPREYYVPDQAGQIAYVDGNIPLIPGRAVLAPRTLAKMLDALDLRPDEMVLDLGCGLGYSTALLARLCEAVVAVEEDDDMADEAEKLLADAGVDNAAVVKADLAAGAPQHGPYDAIIVQGAIQDLPSALADQLKDGGRIVCIFNDGSLDQVRLGIKTGASLGWRWVFDGGAPLLPGFERQAEFVL